MMRSHPGAEHPLLAGPILRRVEPTRVVLWLAMAQPWPIRLILRTASQPEMMFLLDPQSPQLHHIQAGAHLHIMLIDVALPQSLPRDCWIDYRLEVQYEPNGPWQDLTQHCPDMCYPGREMLGFKIPSKVQGVWHGSCRKPHHDSADGLVIADTLMQRMVQEQSHADLSSWPAMLVLSGDQIYGDDVAGPMLRAIHALIEVLNLPNEVLQASEIPSVDSAQQLYQHTDSYYGRTHLLPRDRVNRSLKETLFGGVRKPIFTTETAENHLITLGEYLTMYLLVWSPVVWTFIQPEMPTGLSASNQALYQEEQRIIDQFVEGLPQVQRLLAHLPVAMIFDDHDITDDWNLHRAWEETVYEHPFSRRMIGNGLLAYLVCQGWGNHPDAFPHQMVDPLTQLFQQPGDGSYDDYITQLLHFESWEYTWPTEPPLVVIDTRTRRWRSERAAQQPSGLLDWEAIGDLQHRLRGQDAVLLVSPAPIYGVKLIETIQKIFTWLGKPLMVDAENWMAHPGTAEAILNVFMHRKTPQHFVILSGDVHYSFMYDVELRGRVGGPDIWQITSSGLRNEFPKKLLATLDTLNRWLYAPRSPLNWFTRRRRMRIIPRKPEGHADGRRVLNGAGIGLVELDEAGRPWRVRQFVSAEKGIPFERMEHHSRWQ
ncbi:alkaline phosphatase D family protein [Magnetococcus sp. PR-3]|uniref:alkaline phosphatase D family protein n=1 Tax=Magnetococcus sp. PR-3 TaxID=3120355 RepID=UPI002FCE0C5E